MLGDSLTAAMEEVGPPVPERGGIGAPGSDPGIDPGEFQRRRDDRMGVHPAPQRPADIDDDVFSFDPATLRSDR